MLPKSILISRNAIILLAIFGLTLFFKLGSAPIYILDEARNAQCAWEMKEKKNLIVPSFNYELRVEKPPFHYYGMIVAYSVLGKSAFAARFFSALAGLLTLLAVYWFTKRAADEQLALYSMLFLGLSFHFLFEFRLAVPDPYLILFQALTLFSLYFFATTNRVYWLYAVAIWAAISTLSKGPVAVLIPGISGILFLFSQRAIRKICTIHLLAAALIYLLIAGSWFFLVHNATKGEFTQRFFLEQNLSRFSRAMEGHQNYPGLTLMVVFVGLLPASIFCFQRWQVFRTLWRDSLFAFSAITTLVVLLFYSISATILPNYPMVCYPFAALMLAFLFRETSFNRQRLIILASLYTLLGVIMAIALYHTTELDSTTWVWSSVFGIVPIACLLAYWLFPSQLKVSKMLLVGGFAMFNLVALGFVYPAIYQQNPITKNQHQFNRTTRFAAYGPYNPAINFYIDSPVIRLTSPEAVDSFLKGNRNRVLIGRELETSNLLGRQLKQAVRAKDLFENPTTVFLVYQDSTTITP